MSCRPWNFMFTACSPDIWKHGGEKFNITKNEMCALSSMLYSLHGNSISRKERYLRCISKSQTLWRTRAWWVLLNWKKTMHEWATPKVSSEKVSRVRVCPGHLSVQLQLIRTEYLHLWTWIRCKALNSIAAPLSTTKRAWLKCMMMNSCKRPDNSLALVAVKTLV